MEHSRDDDENTNSRDDESFSDEAAQWPTENDALGFIDIVKDTLRDRPGKYGEFFVVMTDFEAQRINASGVLSRVKELFKGHRNLIVGFNAFLPLGFEITLEDEPSPVKKPLSFEEAINFVDKIRTRFQGDDHVYKSFINILKMYRAENKKITEVVEEVAALFQDHSDLLVEFTHFLTQIQSAASVHNAQPGQDSTLQDDDHEKVLMSSDEEQRRCLKEEEREHDYGDRALDDMVQHFSNQRICGLKGDSDGGYFHQGMQTQKLAFHEKVKERLPSSDDYQKYLRYLHSYNEDTITRSELQLLVGDLLERHPDLKEEFNECLVRDQTGSLWNDGHIPRSLKVDDRERDQEWESTERKKDHGNRKRHRFETSSYGSKDESLAKAILDLSSCECCTSSYRLLPNNYPTPLASERDKSDAQVLNDNRASVPFGRLGFLSKHVRKIQYEQNLLFCEDDRSGQSQVMGGSRAQRLTANDALEFLSAVKNTFQDRTDKYDEFVDIMNDFMAQRTNTFGAVSRLKELFEEHGDLISGFNRFLPRRHEITYPAEVERCAICVEDIKDEEICHTLPNCQHTFHSSCLMTWLDDRHNCPICRTPH